MPPTSSIKNIWQFLEKFKDESSLMMNEKALIVLIYLSRHEGISVEDLIEKMNKHIAQIEETVEFLLSNKFIIKKNGSMNVSEKGKEIVNIIKYSQVNIDEVPKEIITEYILEEILGKGSTSVTFKAIRRKTDARVVIKILKPGMLDHIDLNNKIKMLSNLGASLPNLVLPEDFGEFKWKDITFKYIVMRYVEGRTLKVFLQNKVNNDLRIFLRNFFNEVEKTLVGIENLGLNHGDIHSKNILVVEDALEKDKGIYHFQIIDFIGIKSNEEFREFEFSDFEYFKQHLIKIVQVYASTPSGEPYLKKLGDRFNYIIQNLKNEQYHSFNELDAALLAELPPQMKLKIQEPPFSFIRFEQYDIRDPLWLRRFEPEKSLYEPIKRFDNVICSGPRGCGKTIYLKSLAFVPRLIKLIRDEPENSDLKNKIAYFDNIFGIYFACRQGEFKYFSEKYFKFTSQTQLFIKHIIALRIIKNTIGLISEAYDEGIFTSEPKIQDILKFLDRYLMKELMMTSEAKINPFEQLRTILSTEENNCENILGLYENYPKHGEMLNEHSLIDFFKVLQKTVSELLNIKFYIIFDDISEPQVPLDCQKIINSFMACLNELYCCKFSTEKFAYIYEDMFGKTLQPTNDYTYIDLSFMGKPGDQYKDKVYEQYLENIINRRLEFAGYNYGICELLEELPYSAQELINLLSENAKEYLFTWDKIPGSDSLKLIEFLKHDFDVDWIKIAKIEKIDNNKTIRVSTEKKSLSLSLNDEKTKVNLKIDDGRDDELVAKMKNGKLNIYVKGIRKVYGKIKFAGWELLVQLSSRSVRDGIAICDSIFRECESENLLNKIKNEKIKIPIDIQDRAIRKHSREEYKGLLNITYRGKEIFDIVRNFGELSRKFLVRKITTENIDRRYEVITIERTDFNEISDNAKEILRELIRYSVFLDRGLSFSRSEIGLVQKFTLHKKFTPALMTTYREREHIKLSADSLEEFLLCPDKFREKRLKEETEDEHQLKLLDFLG